MPIEFPEPHQNFGFDNNDHMEKWLNQFATVTNELPKERIRMPALLTSDNLSTWLTTRYANRNKSKVRELGQDVDNHIRQERKKSSSGRGHNDVADSDGYFNWLTPKRAKIVDNDTNANMNTSFQSPIAPTEAVDNGMVRSVSSDSSTLLTPFHEQTCQIEGNDWYNQTCASGNFTAANFCGLLAPYFEQTGNMKVDDWLAKNIDSNAQDSSLSEWLHCAYRSNSERSSGNVTPTISCDDFVTSINDYNAKADENAANRWLANEASFTNMDDKEEKQLISYDDDDESLLEGLEHMNIGSNSLGLDNDWLSNTASNDTSNKAEKNWFLDDYGSFSWTAPKRSCPTIELSGNNSETTHRSQGPLASFDRSSPLNLNDWLIVPNSQTDDNSTDDGSSIVVLSIHN